jgi:hypothetical protein
MVRVRITDPDATVYYPFRFKLGDRVRSKGSSSFWGTIVDAVFEGDMPGAYTVTFTVKTDDGRSFLAMEPEIEELPEAEAE